MGPAIPCIKLTFLTFHSCYSYRIRVLPALFASSLAAPPSSDSIQYCYYSYICPVKAIQMSLIKYCLNVGSRCCCRSRAKGSFSKAQSLTCSLDFRARTTPPNFFFFFFLQDELRHFASLGRGRLQIPERKPRLS